MSVSFLWSLGLSFAQLSGLTTPFSLSHTGIADATPRAVRRVAALLSNLTVRLHYTRVKGLKRIPGIAPGSSGWEPDALLLSYTRKDDPTVTRTWDQSKTQLGVAPAKRRVFFQRRLHLGGQVLVVVVAVSVMIVVLVAPRLFTFFTLFGLGVDVVNLSLVPVVVVAPHDQETKDNDADKALHDGPSKSSESS